MGRGVGTNQETRPYHHGDLRRALLDAALQLIAERDTPDVTLREVARKAGVSHNAPYNHFADKADLIAALAIEGFQKLEASLESAYDKTEGTPLARTIALGSAYVRFALEHRATYRLMFRTDLRETDRDSGNSREAVELAAEAALQIVLQGIAAAQSAGEIEHETSAEMLTLTLWSAMHGLTVLVLDNLVDNVFLSKVDHLLLTKQDGSSLEKTEQLMAQVIRMVLQGL
ncbi:TetR/AcrR family transcriptional regulator [Sulfobacillus harzensis]|uniref:TetR/AcrR family transcriptional regulator n=1 Tax=Sulfobacillus harzensis TaxID=2729629 RepID=A0A7Y0L1Q9_9FIRM|nr:TetR/AcrR family transcriptional regulator [Sulfobacillus harzensis]NMP21683.1 TetR/AcrR family transcriptional regulator [Sulfobacillus harzensis]